MGSMCKPADRIPQVDRMDAIAAVHAFKVRVVVATDLASRGLDLANVNLVGGCTCYQHCCGYL